MALRFSLRPWSIRLKSVLLAVGYLLALCAVYGAFSMYVVRREVAEARDRLEQTARIVAAQLDATVVAGAQRLEMVAQLPGLTYGLQTIQDAKREGYIPPWTTLHYLFFKLPVFGGGVFLLDRAGKVLWTEPPGLPWMGQTLTDTTPIDEIYRTRRTLISGVLGRDRLLDHPHVLVGVPIQNDSGDLQGMLGGVIDLTTREFTDVLGPVSTTDGRFVEAVDQNDVVLASTGIAPALQRGEPIAMDGDAITQASVSLTHAPWRIVAGQPSSRALAAVWRLQHALWAIGLALVLMAATVAAPLLNGLVRSIKQLNDAAETVARGDLSQPVVVGKRRDEFATLARTFEQMRVELARSHRALEQRLHEREDLIQELMRVNEDLRSAQARLIEAERFAAIGELSAAVAHGIRNPVAGIKAAAQLASSELPTPHPLDEHITDIVSEANKLEARIRALLDFAKPFEPHPAPCRVDHLVNDAVNSLRSQVAVKGIDLEIDLQPALPEVEIDRAQMEEVLLALLWNAVEAMPQGGKVTVAGRLSDKGRQLRLDIVDTGPGIGPHQLGHVFDLFFTTKSSGTGFGLAVAQKIIKRHGGLITVHSELGTGTTFTIELPLSHRSG
jgi:signal transduction histidine kinase